MPPAETEVSDAAVTAVRVAVGLLVARDFETLAAMTRYDRLSAAEIQAAVEGYGRTLVAPPQAAWADVEFTAVAGQPIPTFHVACDLWTVEEGRSDLTLELELREEYAAAYEVRLLNLHVL